RAQQILQNPLASLYYRRSVGIGSNSQQTALPQQAAAIRIVQRHAPQLRSVNSGNAVVPRQALIQKRIIGAQQFERAAVLAENALKEQLSFRLEAGPQALVPFGEGRRIRP